MQKDININWVITFTLWFFLGMLGIHRFFNWKVWTGILMIITLGWLWIWWLIDGIIIVMWKFTDAENNFIPVKIDTIENKKI